MANQSLISEFWEFVKYRKRYWLVPILIMLGLVSGYGSPEEITAISDSYTGQYLAKILGR